MPRDSKDQLVRSMDDRGDGLNVHKSGAIGNIMSVRDLSEERYDP